MAGKRVVAVLAAALLVTAALLVRRALDDGPDGGGATDGGSTARVVCITDLEAVCDALDVRGVTTAVEPYTATLDAFAAGNGPDAWVTVAPLDRLAVGPDGEAVLGDPLPLASTQLALAVRAERTEALTSACGGAISWRCIGEHAGQPWAALGGQSTWGSLAPGHDDPATRASGLLTLGIAAASYFGRSDFNSVDMDADDEFLGWFSRLVRAVPAFVLSAGSALDPLATGRAVDLAGTTDADLATLGGAQSSRFGVTYPEPMGRADAVLVIAADADVPTTLPDAALASARTAPGWTPPTDGPSGLPSAGVLRTLLDLWTSIR